MYPTQSAFPGAGMAGQFSATQSAFPAASSFQTQFSVGGLQRAATAPGMVLPMSGALAAAPSFGSALQPQQQQQQQPLWPGQQQPQQQQQTQAMFMPTASSMQMVGGVQPVMGAGGMMGGMGGSGGTGTIALQPPQNQSRSSSGQLETEMFMSFGAMPNFADKSHEELRLEDYLLNNKPRTGQQAGVPASGMMTSGFPGMPGATSTFSTGFNAAATMGMGAAPQASFGGMLPAANTASFTPGQQFGMATPGMGTSMSGTQFTTPFGPGANQGMTPALSGGMTFNATPSFTPAGGLTPSFGTSFSTAATQSSLTAAPSSFAPGGFSMSGVPGGGASTFQMPGQSASSVSFLNAGQPTVSFAGSLGLPTASTSFQTSTQQPASLFPSAPAASAFQLPVLQTPQAQQQQQQQQQLSAQQTPQLGFSLASFGTNNSGTLSGVASNNAAGAASNNAGAAGNQGSGVFQSPYGNPVLQSVRVPGLSVLSSGLRTATSVRTPRPFVPMPRSAGRIRPRSLASAQAGEGVVDEAHKNMVELRHQEFCSSQSSVKSLADRSSQFVQNPGSFFASSFARTPSSARAPFLHESFEQGVGARTVEHTPAAGARLAELEQHAPSPSPQPDSPAPTVEVVRPALVRKGGEQPMPADPSVLPRVSSAEIVLHPPLEELSRMSEDQLRAVRDFTVEFTDKGKIVFEGATDVRGLDIDAIVQFENNCICMYEKVNRKPRKGEELNKASTIYLRNMLPRNPAIAKKYEARLRSKLQSLGATFVSYDADEGVLVFRVDSHV